MPYIKPNNRTMIDGFIDNLIQVADGDDGNLNYAISRLVASSYAPDGKWRYSAIQRARGLYACVADEFYDRVARPYEDECRKRNGDVPEYLRASAETLYLASARIVVASFPADGLYKRVEFDKCGYAADFTDRLHADRYVVMGQNTVMLGPRGLELRTTNL